MKYWPFFLLALLSLCFSIKGNCHPLAPSLLQLEETAQGIEMTWKTPRKIKGAAMSPRLPSTCHFDKQPSQESGFAPSIARDQKSVVLKSLLQCETGKLTGESIGINNIDKNVTSVLLRYKRLDGSVISSLLSNESPTFVIPEKTSSFEIIHDYLSLGVDHLIFGFDHVLFVIALLLLTRQLKKLIGAITFFTLGHSITLALASLKVVTLPSTLIEIAIAGSILFVAFEIVNRTKRPSNIERRYWILPLAFGLLHGMGFAGALAETGLPQGEIPLALFAFNVGIELGQLMIIACWLLSAFAIHKLFSNEQFGRIKKQESILAYGIGGISVFWIIDRSQGLLW